MRVARFVLLTILLATAPAWAQEDDPQVQELWSRWLEDPLDLREASAAEIALLPWVDHEEAALIEGLAREGALRELDDLAAVPGLDAETIEALAPFVDLDPLPARRKGWSWEWRQDETFEPRDGTGFRRTLTARGHGIAAAVRWRDGRAARGWGRVGGRGWTLAAGTLRARPATALLRGDPTVRSRTASLSSRLHPAAPWAGSLSVVAPSRATALTLESGSLQGTAFVVWEDGAPPSAWGEVRVQRDSLAWGLAADVSESVEGAAWWRRRLGDVLLRVETAGGAVAWRSAAATVWSPDRWRIGLAATHAFQATGGGSDPITQLALDREHRSWQLSVRRRWSGATLTGLARRTQRGDPPDREGRSRLRLWLRADLQPPPGDRPRARWQLHLRLGRDREGPDRAQEASPNTQVRVELRRRHAGLRQRLVVSHRGRPGAESRAMTVQIDGTGSWRWRVVYAAAIGQRSHPWAAGLPHAALFLHWLAPGENVALVGVGRSRGGLRWGAWFGSVWSGQEPASWEGGCSLRWSGGTRASD